MLRCLNPWKEWVAKMKRARKLLKRIMQGAERLHFGGWKEYVQNEHQRRQEIAKKAMKRFLMRREFAVWNAWYGYVEKKKRIMTMMRRAIGAPSFGHWVDYVAMIKEQKVRAACKGPPSLERGSEASGARLRRCSCALCPRPL
jgi:hypothetical protein